MSQEELGAVVGWSVGHLRFIEQGKRPITPAFAVALAKALHAIRPLDASERATLGNLGAPPEELARLTSPPVPPTLSRFAPALNELLRRLGPEGFALWIESSLTAAAAVAAPIPRLTGEEVDPATGARWKVAIVDPAFVKPRQESPDQGAAAPKRRRKQS